MKFLNVDKKSLILVVFSTIMMGFCVAFLNKCNFGTDPCTTTNLGIAELLGIRFGLLQGGLNTILLVFVFICDKRQIGWGTISNMYLVGFGCDFMTWLLEKISQHDIFTSFTVRAVVVVPALILFIFSASLYMALQLGTSPYDAISFIIAEKQKKFSFKTVRIIYDITFVIIGFLLGQTVGFVTVIMAFCLGPVIAWMRENIIEKYIVKTAEAE